MKALSLVVSARARGNCRDFSEYILDNFSKHGIQTEQINFYDYKILPCQHCNYECLQKHDPNKKINSPCPVEDDVYEILKKTWEAQILLLFIPNYGGLPPALWVAFSQRQQAFFKQEPIEKLKKYVVSAVVLAAPHWSTGSQWTVSIMSDEVKNLNRRVAGFEVINNAGYETDNLFGSLIREDEVKKRLDFICARTIKAANEISD
ncbi:MAG: hypothetical protein PWQ60_1859 [Thermoanaerobacteraceae bacterium]|nr:hypothetical protein [Thermoanaerobacteraceae bacterium]